MDNIKNHTTVKGRLIPLLTNPFHLFAELFKFLEPQFEIISNPIYTDWETKLRFDELSEFFFTGFKNIYGAESNTGYLE